MIDSTPRGQGIRAMAEFLLLKHHPAIAYRMVEELEAWMEERIKSDALSVADKDAIIKEFVC
jgi:hypothetical protein